jgi:hypothetical protein
MACACAAGFQIGGDPRGAEGMAADPGARADMNGWPPNPHMGRSRSRGESLAWAQQFEGLQFGSLTRWRADRTLIVGKTGSGKTTAERAQRSALA